MMDSLKVDEYLHNDLIKPIEEDEIKKIVIDSPQNKSPGIDSYSNEFYQAFWTYISKYVTEAFNEALSEGELGISQKKRGNITHP